MSSISRQAEQAVSSNTEITKKYEEAFKRWDNNEGGFGDLVLSRTIGDLIKLGLATTNNHPKTYDEIMDVVSKNIKVVASTKREALISIGGVVCHCNKYGVISYITQCSLGLKGYGSLQFFTGRLSEIIKDVLGVNGSSQYVKGEKMFDYTNMSLEGDLFATA